MKKHRWMLPLLAALLLPLCAHTEPEVPMVRYSGKLSVPADSTYVDFGDIIISDWDTVIRFLRQLPQLERCDMYATTINRSNVEKLAATFPDVTFGWTMRIGSMGDYHYIRTDAEVFSTYHATGTTGHGSDSFQVLRFCPHLKALDIGHNHATDLSWLSGLTEMRVLIIAINDVADISPLASLTELEYLEMFRTKVTDISPLAGLTKLKDLNISYNNITDLSPLYGLKQLERLWVYNAMPVGAYAPISAENERALREALPNTYIDNENPPTAGGWRDHPRYSTVAQMFFEGGTAYIPFAEEDTTQEEPFAPMESMSEES